MDNQPRLSKAVDWIAFTLLQYTEPSCLMERFPNIEFKEMGRGLNGYKSGLVSPAGGIKLLFDGTDTMGIHCIMSATGISELVEACSMSAAEFMRLVRNDLAAKFTRIDFAIDDQEGYSSLDLVRHHLISDAVSSRWRNYTPMGKQTIKGNVWKGEGLAFGERSGESMLTVYNKRLERLSKGALESDLPEHWVRWEFRFMKDKADRIATLFLAEGWAPIVGTCRKLIEFKDVAQTTVNVTRQKAAAWWQALMVGAEGCLETVPRPSRMYHQVRAWCYRQVSAAVAMMLAVEGQLGVDQLVFDGTQKWKAHHFRMAAAGT